MCVDVVDDSTSLSHVELTLVLLLTQCTRYAVTRAGYNYDSASTRRPFDCLSKVIKVTVT